MIGLQYIQPTANQPVIVPMNGGYVVVPAKGQDVQVVVSLSPFILRSFRGGFCMLPLSLALVLGLQFASTCTPLPTSCLPLLPLSYLCKPSISIDAPQNRARSMEPGTWNIGQD